ncbi:Meiotic recombination protein DMC1 homolog [Linum perenne]
MTQDANCPLYHHVEETSGDVLRDYNFTKMVWNRFGEMDTFVTQWSMDTSAWLCFYFNSGFGKRLYGHGQFESHGETVQLAWDPVLVDCIPINSDGSVNPISRQASARGLIRDAEGRCLLVFTINLGTCSITRAEMSEAITGLELAWDKGFRKVVLQLDSLAVISLLTSEDDTDHQHHIETIRFRELKNRDLEVVVQHTYSEENCSADFLASLGAEDVSQLQLVEREEIDDEDELFEAIDKLISQGINAGDVKKLQDAGIYTCNGLMMHTKKNLTGIKGLSEAKVDKICEAAEKLVNFGYITGSDALLRRKAVVRITTGSQALDELLGGRALWNRNFVYYRSFWRVQVWEDAACTYAMRVYSGSYLTLLLIRSLPTNMNGGNGKVAYIDTEGTFRPDRIVPIAERFGMDAGAVLDNIIYARAYTYEHQYNLLLGLAAKMSEEPFRLLIVDSVIALFRVDFTGRGELAERQQKLAQMLSRLTKIAEEFNVAVYMTNQVIADPGGGVFISDPKKPAGGHVLAHAATIRLMFRKGKGEQRVCKVFDAPNLPEAEAISF